MRAHPRFAVCLGLLLVAACKKDEPAPEEVTRTNGLTVQERAEVVAHVGTHEITLGAFADKLANQSPYLRARYASPERRRELLESMIRFELLAQEAERRGLTNDPEVQRAESQALVQALLAQEIEARVQAADISDADVKAYYEAHASDFSQPEQVRATHIRVADRATAQRLLNQVTAPSADESLFARLAREASNDPTTRERSGDLRFFSKPEEGAARVENDVPAQVAAAAFGLTRVGEIHRAVVESPDGFHIVKLLARRQAMHRTLDEVRQPIRSRLYRERRDALQASFIEGLRTRANVQVDERVLADVRVNAPAETHDHAHAGHAHDAQREARPARRPERR